jgi:hypothetical protein
MQISKHFNLDELVHSDYGVRHDIDNTPPPNVRAALVKLTNNILEPLRVKAGRPVIVQMGLPFDQLILEFGRWVHVSHAASGKQRGQILTATKINGQTRYLSGLHR